MTQADAIREWIIRSLITPARAKGLEELELRAGDVHDKFGLRGRVPNVCNVLSGHKLADEAGLELIEPRPAGPKPNAVFRFRLLPMSHQSSSLGSVQHTEIAGGHRLTLLGQSITHSAAEPGPAQCERRVETLSLTGPGAAGGTTVATIAPHELAAALVLVSCGKSKRRTSSPARDLYLSAGFQKARRIAEQAAEWRILSAKYGLLHPDARIEPYDSTLNAMGATARRQWAQLVLELLVPLARNHCHVIFLAGRRYRDDLVPDLKAAGIQVSVPMERLRQGEQQAWLGQQAARFDRQ